MMVTVPPPGSVPTPEAQAPISHFGRIVGALFNPKATFQDIVRRPSWIAPIILLTLVSLGTTIVFTQRVGWNRFMTKQIEQSPRTAQLTPEQRQQAIERGAAFAKGFGLAGSAVSYVIIALIVSGVLMGAMNLMAGAGVRFSTAMGIVSHAMLPGGIAGVLAILILYLKDPDTVDLENLVGSNVGAFLGAESPKWLVKLGTSLDIFSFWMIFLLGVGFSAANPKKLSVGRALGIVLGVWALYVGVKVCWAVVFS